MRDFEQNNNKKLVNKCSVSFIFVFPALYRPCCVYTCNILFHQQSSCHSRYWTPFVNSGPHLLAKAINKKQPLFLYAHIVCSKGPSGWAIHLYRLGRANLVPCALYRVFWLCYVMSTNLSTSTTAAPIHVFIYLYI